MITNTHRERHQLRMHLAARHGAGTRPDEALAALVNLHEHEHDGPGTIRNHPRTDLDWDRADAETTLSECGVAVDTATDAATPGRQYPRMQVCDSCFDDITVVGNLSAHTAVAHHNGAWVLISEPGHRDDIIATFDEPPRADPVGGGLLDWIDFYGDDDDARLNADALEDWDSTARAAATKALRADNLGDAWAFVEELRAAGYNRAVDGDVELWVYDQVARIIDAYHAGRR